MMAFEDNVKEPTTGKSKETFDQFGDGSDDIPRETRQMPTLKRKLKSRHLQMIAIGKPTIRLPMEPLAHCA